MRAKPIDLKAASAKVEAAIEASPRGGMTARGLVSETGLALAVVNRVLPEIVKRRGWHSTWIPFLPKSDAFLQEAFYSAKRVE